MIEVLDRDEAAARCGSPLFRGAAFYPQAATVHPARLAAGLRRRLVERGVATHESSPVLSLAEEGGAVVARTALGTVRADRAVLAAGSSLLRFRPLRERSPPPRATW